MSMVDILIDMQKVADFPMVTDIEKVGDMGVFRVEIESKDIGMHFRDMLHKETNLKVMTESHTAPIFYLTEREETR